LQPRFGHACYTGNTCKRNLFQKEIIYEIFVSSPIILILWVFYKLIIAVIALIFILFIVY
jgi:ABC-type multidrug transport system permease subunit